MAGISKELDRASDPVAGSPHTHKRVVLAALFSLAILTALSLAALRAFKLLLFVKVPIGSMSPAISPGDHVSVEGFSFLFSQAKARRNHFIQNRWHSLVAPRPNL